LVAEFTEIKIEAAGFGDFALVRGESGSMACGIIQHSNVFAYQGDWLTGVPKARIERAFTWRF